MVALGGVPDVGCNTKNMLPTAYLCSVFSSPVIQKHSKCQKSFFVLIGIFLKEDSSHIDRSKIFDFSILSSS